ncbi:hypothetical protein EDC56_1918 [Sinobacterium caligoides]|uniref:Uncharacterized protein n=1 Tax=Sinobacterium caligoides TaxID=933926 RepID=A0A3N2DNY3_9GAMM|nr:hypothetical protein EDC56_1918 [Sinobacterium caligoides]
MRWYEDKEVIDIMGRCRLESDGEVASLKPGAAPSQPLFNYSTVSLRLLWGRIQYRAAIILFLGAERQAALEGAD